MQYHTLEQFSATAGQYSGAIRGLRHPVHVVVLDCSRASYHHATAHISYDRHYAGSTDIIIAVLTLCSVRHKNDCNQ
jgi:hypothetical protein